ncbi:protein kinase [Myxococcota bacterium]|nr:protein kinase [Myxococcota bacterium]
MQGAPVHFGRYKLVSLLGEGGMAKVYRAVLSGPMGFEKEVALKKIDSRLTQDDRFVKALINEARLGGQLRHKNIVEVYEFDQFEGDYFLAMEFVDGWTLDSVLRTCRKEGRYLPPGVVLDVAIQICRGLEFAHSLRDKDGQEMHLVHRDLKPANVIVSRSGDVKIMDFGIAKADSNLYKTTAADVTKGTPIYMSPEQVRGEALDARSDLFSLGSIIHELATLRVVFGGDQLLTIMHKVLQADVREAVDRAEERVAGLGPVLSRAMARNAGDRFPTARELQRELERLRAALPPELGACSLPAFLDDLGRWGTGGEGADADSGEDARSMPTGTQSLESTRAVAEGNSGLGSFTRAFLETGKTEARRQGPVPIGPGSQSDQVASAGGAVAPNPLTERARGFFDTSAEGPSTTERLATGAVRQRQKLMILAATGAIVVLSGAILWQFLRGGGAGTGSEEIPAASTPPVEAPAATGGQEPPAVARPIEVTPAEAPPEAPAEPTPAEVPKAAPPRVAQVEVSKTAKAPTPARAPDPTPSPPPETRPKAPEPTVAAATPTPAGRGKIRVNSKPWSHVYLDGQPIGQTPRRDYEVSAGSHVLTLRCGSCATPQQKEVPFSVEPGQTKDIGLVQFQD